MARQMNGNGLGVIPICANLRNLREKSNGDPLLRQSAQSAGEIETVIHFCASLRNLREKLKQRSHFCASLRNLREKLKRRSISAPLCAICRSP